VQTIQSIQRFQQARTLTAQGDVSAVEPWMSIHYVSRFYSVPESYLIEHLNITNTRIVTRVPLRTLAFRYNRSIDALIRDLQTAIKAYRKQNPHRLSFSNLHVNKLLALERSMT
jgi:hypothetical protein